MRTVANNPVDAGTKRVTIPYIGRYLEESGLNVERAEKSVLVNLGYDLGFQVGLQKGKLSISVALPVYEEDAEMAIELANITMADTMMTKVFLLPEDEDLNLWFSVESFCKTRAEFEEFFEPSFKLLLNSVRTYIKIREEMQNAIGAEDVANMIMENRTKGQPS